MNDTQKFFEIHGGNRLHGEISISGAKNSCLPIMAATLLAKGTSHIENVPRLKDVFTLIEVLKSLRASVEWKSDHSLEIDTSDVTCLEPDPELVNKMRASVLVMGPLFGRFGQAMIPMPGGCSLGKRPIDIHLDGMHALGGTTIEHPDSITVKLSKGKRPVGNTIPLRFPSVGATENIMMAAALSEGVTVIENAAREPEISDLGLMLTSMGARVIGAGESTVTIVGTNELFPARHVVIPDRIEAGTYLIAAAITGGKVTLENVRHDHMTSTLEHLASSGCMIITESDRITIDAPDMLEPTDIRTQPYPGFSTDIQPQYMALMTKASGNSLFVEKIFERRLLAAEELKQMGAEIRVLDNCALVCGGKRLMGCKVNAPDIRAAAALMIAGLWAEGTTQLKGLEHLYRGYEIPVEKLTMLGADVKEISIIVPEQSEVSGL